VDSTERIENMHSPHDGPSVIHRRTRDPVPSLACGHNQAHVAFQRGRHALTAHDLRRAEDAFMASLAYAADADDASGQARALQGLGLIADHRRDFVLALETYRLALPLYQHARHLTGQMLVTHLIGLDLIQLMRISEAADAFRLSLLAAEATMASMWATKAHFWLDMIEQSRDITSPVFWQETLRCAERIPDDDASS
jgi:tetratricopeptide (TPR) repeat protein